MRASVLDLFPAFYDERQTASAAVHIAHLDMQLIEAFTDAAGNWKKAPLSLAKAS